MSGPATAAFPIGRFGLFRLIDRIDDGAGEGGSELYRALWAFMPREPERLCVVKRLRPELCSSPAFVRMFEKEAEVLAALDHPNLVKTFERGLVETVPYVAMEFLEGIDLASLLQSIRMAGGTLSVEVAIYIAHEIARGLAYGHAACDREGNPLGLVHRDIKPTNIVLMPGGGVKVIEFGATRVSSFIGQNVTSEGGRANRPSYVAPEQVRGGMVDARADLFSLGAVLWEMLTGRPLFPAADPRETSAKLLTGDLLRPSVLRSEVPAALDDVMMKLLHRDLSKRHQSAASIVHDLALFLPAPADDARAVGSLVRSHMETRSGTVPAPTLLPNGKPVPAALAGVLEAVVANMRAGGLAGRLPGSIRKITSFVPMVAAKFPRRSSPRPNSDLAPAISINTPAGSFTMPRRPLWPILANVMAVGTIVIGATIGWQFLHREATSDALALDPVVPSMMETAYASPLPPEPIAAGIVIESLPPPQPAGTTSPAEAAAAAPGHAKKGKRADRATAGKASRRKRATRVYRRRVSQTQAAAVARPTKK